MEIFGKHIFGNDAKAWLKLCKEQKKEWILKYTKQSNETLIDEFINNPNISKECKCLDCGKNKVNESNGISKEVEQSNEIVSTPRVSKRGTNKGRKDNKTS
jgi:hypothetical protein